MDCSHVLYRVVCVVSLFYFLDDERQVIFYKLTASHFGMQPPFTGTQPRRISITASQKKDEPPRYTCISLRHVSPTADPSPFPVLPSALSALCPVPQSIMPFALFRNAVCPGLPSALSFTLHFTFLPCPALPCPALPLPLPLPLPLSKIGLLMVDDMACHGKLPGLQGCK